MAAAPTPCPKICDLIAQKKAAGEKFFSFECFPPVTPQGVTNLLQRLERFAVQKPLFVDFTWRAGGSSMDVTLELSIECWKTYGMPSNMHLTCTNMPEGMVKAALDRAQAAGIRNIVALRGDPPAGQERWEAATDGFASALDLVKYIRANYGDYFCISVAGYPEGHPDRLPESNVISDADWEIELNYLKEKVAAGADLIITQMFYDVPQFAKFVNDARARGITVPILPGIMPIQNYAGWRRMTAMCKTRIPPQLLAGADAVQEDDNNVKRYGIESGAQFCRDLYAAGCDGLHFYTLNAEPVTYGMMQNLGIYVPSPDCDAQLLPVV